MTADEAATRLEEMLACQQGPIVHHCHDHHRAVELGEHIDAVLLELDRLRHYLNVEADLRWTRALVRRLWRDATAWLGHVESVESVDGQTLVTIEGEEPDSGPARWVGITATIEEHLSQRMLHRSRSGVK